MRRLRRLRTYRRCRRCWVDPNRLCSCNMRRGVGGRWWHYGQCQGLRVEEGLKKGWKKRMGEEKKGKTNGGLVENNNWQYGGRMGRMGRMGGQNRNRNRNRLCVKYSAGRPLVCP